MSASSSTDAVPAADDGAYPQPADADPTRPASREGTRRVPRRASFLGDLPSSGTSWHIKPGQYFGEWTSLSDGALPVATYEGAAKGCTLLSLPRAAFLSLFSGDASLQSEVHIYPRGSLGLILTPSDSF